MSVRLVIVMVISCAAIITVIVNSQYDPRRKVANEINNCWDKGLPAVFVANRGTGLYEIQCQKDTIAMAQYCGLHFEGDTDTWGYRWPARDDGLCYYSDFEELLIEVNIDRENSEVSP